MSLIIRKGAAEDLDAVEKLYGEVCDHMAATVNYTGWRRDIYPARQDAEAGIREGTLFLAEEDGEAAGSFIPPSWFAEDVTYSSEYHNSNLSKI